METMKAIGECSATRPNSEIAGGDCTILLQSRDTHAEGRTLWNSLNAYNQRAVFLARRPGRRPRRIERDNQELAGFVIPRALKTNALGGNIYGHGFFEPGYLFWSHSDGQSKRSPRTAPPLGFHAMAVAVKRGPPFLFKSQAHGKRCRSTPKFERSHDLIRLRGTLLGPNSLMRMFCPRVERANGLVHLTTANNARGSLWLPAVLEWIIGKRDPNWHARAVRLFAREQQPASANIDGFAVFALLLERGGPSQSCGEPQPHTMMPAAIHKSNSTTLERTGSGYVAKVFNPAKPRTRTKKPDFRVAVYSRRC